MAYREALELVGSLSHGILEYIMIHPSCNLEYP